jgi:hypothetical protein
MDGGDAAALVGGVGGDPSGRSADVDDGHVAGAGFAGRWDFLAGCGEAAERSGADFFPGPGMIDACKCGFWEKNRKVLTVNLYWSPD